MSEAPLVDLVTQPSLGETDESVQGRTDEDISSPPSLQPPDTVLESHAATLKRSLPPPGSNGGGEVVDALLTISAAVESLTKVVQSLDRKLDRHFSTVNRLLTNLVQCTPETAAATAPQQVKVEYQVTPPDTHARPYPSHSGAGASGVSGTGVRSAQQATASSGSQPPASAATLPQRTLPIRNPFFASSPDQQQQHRHHHHHQPPPPPPPSQPKFQQPPPPPTDGGGFGKTLPTAERPSSTYRGAIDTVGFQINPRPLLKESAVEAKQPQQPAEPPQAPLTGAPLAAAPLSAAPLSAAAPPSTISKPPLFPRVTTPQVAGRPTANAASEVAQQPHPPPPDTSTRKAPIFARTNSLVDPFTGDLRSESYANIMADAKRDAKATAERLEDEVKRFEKERSTKAQYETRARQLLSSLITTNGKSELFDRHSSDDDEDDGFLR